MATIKKRQTTVFSKPEFSRIDRDRKDYNHQLWKLDFFCSQEMHAKDLKKETVTWLKDNGVNKDYLRRVNSLSEGFFSLVGKYCYAMNNGAQLDTAHRERVRELIDMRLPVSEVVEENSPSLNKKPSVSIQDAMWAQVEPLVSELDAAIDNRDYKINVYNLLVSSEYAKAAKIRLVKAYFAKELAFIESNEDPEYYSQYTPAQLRKLVSFLKDIDVACDTIINSQKQQRTPRKKKETPASKIVEKVKFSAKNVELGLVSINPIDILQSSLVWYYNEKKRKLGFFQTDEFNTAISFKGTSIIGFGTSGEKTVRNPEAMKGFQKFSKAKMLKFYKDLTTKEGIPSPRTSDDMIFLKKW